MLWRRKNIRTSVWRRKGPMVTKKDTKTRRKVDDQEKSPTSTPFLWMGEMCRETLFRQKNHMSLMIVRKYGAEKLYIRRLIALWPWKTFALLSASTFITKWIYGKKIMRHNFHIKTPLASHSVMDIAIIPCALHALSNNISHWTFAGNQQEEDYFLQIRHIYHNKSFTVDRCWCHTCSHRSLIWLALQALITTN